MQVQTLDATDRDYISELKTGYEQQIHKLQIDILEYKNKYIEIKEKYDLLVYKKFVRSGEQLLAQEKQPSLFTEEAETKEEQKEEEETTEVKSHTRKKSGRKMLDAALPREDLKTICPTTGKSDSLSG